MWFVIPVASKPINPASKFSPAVAHGMQASALALRGEGRRSLLTELVARVVPECPVQKLSAGRERAADRDNLLKLLSFSFASALGAPAAPAFPEDRLAALTLPEACGGRSSSLARAAK
jgi:hypothetical protein